MPSLVSGDLHRAVYVDFNSGVEPQETAIEDITGLSHFEALQQVNSIKRLNLDNPNQIEVDIEIKTPAMLVLTEVWYPGWMVTVDGRPAEIHRVNYCQRGVWLDKGRHYVRFYFKPVAWRIGMGISLGTLALIVFLLGLSQIRQILSKNFFKSNN